MCNLVVDVVLLLKETSARSLWWLKFPKSVFFGKTSLKNSNKENDIKCFSRIDATESVTGQKYCQFYTNCSNLTV